MHLVVHIPYRPDDESARALSLARRAPSFTMERVEDRKVAIAIYSSLPAGIDEAIRLVGEAVQLPGAWASMDSKRVSSLAKLWQRLACYRESLDVEDAMRYCREKSALFNTLVGCEEHHCPVPCQFICTPCMKMKQEGKTVIPAYRYKVAVELAEIEWCPRLHLPSDEPAAVIKPRSVKSSAAPVSESPCP
jgi:hypothetical protein